MTNRITERDLESLVTRINVLTDSPVESYTKDGVNRYSANVGNYHLAYAYGGVTLHRMSNTSGGVTNVLHCGYTTKRDLYNRLQAFILGLTNEDGIK